MAGIETLFGASGLITLGIELGACAAKLRRFYMATKLAAQTVETLVTDLETMAIGLQQLEQHRQHDRHSEVFLERTVKSCQRCTAEIRQIVDQMQQRILVSPKMKGRLYVATKHTKMKELLNDLERAKSSLMLAFMMYLSTEQALRAQEKERAVQQQEAQAQKGYELQREILSNLQSLDLCGNSNSSQRPYFACEAERRSEGILAHVNTTALRGTAEKDDVRQTCQPFIKKQFSLRDHKRQYSAGVRLPTWLSSRIWRVTISGSRWAWNIEMRSLNLVPRNSLMFRYCASGNIAEMHKLVESGQASPLDVLDSPTFHGGYHTLLHHAAVNKQPGVCRYLLSSTSWSNQTMAVISALSSSYVQRLWNNLAVTDISLIEEMTRIFVQAPAFDADIYISKKYVQFWSCPSLQCLDLLIASSSLDFQHMTSQARFEKARQLPICSCADFLKCLGLDRSNPSLATLTAHHGTTLLHYIAVRINALTPTCLYHDYECSCIRAWTNLRVQIMKMGVDPCSGRYNDYNRSSYDEALDSTPLLCVLGLSSRGPWRTGREGYVYRSQGLELWISMVQEAGVDLGQYGREEKRCWKAWETEIETKLFHGSSPSDWTLKKRHAERVHLYRLSAMPGAFGLRNDVPSQIIWPPNWVEQNEGHWETVASRSISTSSRDFKDIISAETDRDIIHRVDSAQDDAEMVVLMQYRASRSATTRPRSHSQPRCLYTREVEFYAGERSSRRPWLPRFHLCPFDSRWKFECERLGWEDYGDDWQTLRDCISEPRFQVRSCVKGVFAHASSLQESDEWRWYSFLAEIANMQDDRHEADEDRRFGGPSCPLRFDSSLARGVTVDVERLNVPEELRPFHPKLEFR